MGSLNEEMVCTPEDWTDDRNENRIYVGNLLKGIRESMKLTQVQLSDMCLIVKNGEITTIDQGTISKIEAGKWGPSIDTIWAILNAMGYEISFTKKTQEGMMKRAQDISNREFQKQLEIIRKQKNNPQAQKIADELEAQMAKMNWK